MNTYWHISAPSTKLFALTVAGSLLLVGCALFQEEMLRSADKVQDGVDAYCEASQQNRETFRSAVNPTPGGATIIVTCPGDPGWGE